MSLRVFAAGHGSQAVEDPSPGLSAAGGTGDSPFRARAFALGPDGTANEPAPSGQPRTQRASLAKSPDQACRWHAKALAARRMEVAPSPVPRHMARAGAVFTLSQRVASWICPSNTAFFDEDQNVYLGKRSDDQPCRSFT